MLLNPSGDTPRRGFVSPAFQENRMKLKKLAEVTMWLPGFAPDDQLPEARCTAEIIAFPLVNEVHDLSLIHI